VRFTVIFDVRATVSVELDLPPDSTWSDAVGAAEMEVDFSLCHSCARRIDMHELGDPLSVIDESGEELPEDD